ncbi:MAG: hypothetical protein Q4F54_00045 [Coriobacteriia bacterium]|nr:hypothetical protein [Coriobacteriia bacterium]
MVKWMLKKADGTLTDVRDMVDGDLNFVAVVSPNENKVNFAVSGDTRAQWVNAETGEAVTSLTALSGSKYTSYYNSDEAKAYVTITDAETNGATTYVTKPEVVNDGTVICKSLDNVGDNVVIAGEDVTFTADFTFINSPASTPKTGDSINLTKLVILCMFIGLMITAFGYRRRFIRR